MLSIPNTSLHPQAPSPITLPSSPVHHLTEFQNHRNLPLLALLPLAGRNGSLLWQQRSPRNCNHRHLFSLPRKKTGTDLDTNCGPARDNCSTGASYFTSPQLSFLSCLTGTTQTTLKAHLVGWKHPVQGLAGTQWVV